MWTNERESILQRMWKGGASASIIGDELGLSRNAVIGKVHRLKLEPRESDFKHSRRAVTGRSKTQSRANEQGGVSKRGETLPRVYLIRAEISREPTKGELRRLFEEAWRNTATLSTNGE